MNEIVNLALRGKEKKGKKSMKKVCSIILAVMMVVSMIPVWTIAVSAEDHVHVFASEWTTDKTAHWHACTAADCDIEDYATCGLEGAAYGTHTIVNGKCQVCNCDCPHKFENDSPVCTLCGKTFYRAYDVNLTGSTLTFKIDVLDKKDEPYNTYGKCYRFDMFLIASDNEPVVNYEKVYDLGCKIGVNEYGSTGDFPDNGVSNYVRNGNTFTVTILLDQLDEITGFKGIYGLTAETTCVWLNIRPCSSAALDYDEPSWMRFYDSTMLVFKYGEYLVKAPKAAGTTGTYNKRVYKVDESNKVDLMAKAWETDKKVTFEDWYLRTMIQYQAGEDGALDIRFASMLDENLGQYKEAGFIVEVNGQATPITLKTTEAVKSFVADDKTYTIGEFSEADDYFFLQNTVFAASLVRSGADVKVTPFVTLMDGTTTLKGASVTFNLGTIADIAGIRFKPM